VIGVAFLTRSLNNNYEIGQTLGLGAYLYKYLVTHATCSALDGNAKRWSYKLSYCNCIRWRLECLGQRLNLFVPPILSSRGEIQREM
jgi:hypothetical protein